MKKALIGLLAVILVISLCACGRCEEHKFLSSGYWVEKEATCTSEGVGVKVCGECGYEVETVIPVKEHNFLSSKYRVEKEATCIAEGVGVEVCGECGYEEETVIPVTKHHYVEIKSTQECTKSGKITYECSVCKDAFEKDGDALGHLWVAPTCQKAKYCSRCNITEGEKASHNFYGSKCTVCGIENTKTVTCKGVNFIVPIEAKANNRDTITKISNINITFEDTYGSYSRLYVNYSAECIKSSVFSNGFSYTLYDKEGYVISSSNAYATDMKTGEKTRNQHFFFDLPHVSGDLKAGETYRLVISDAN